MKESILLNHQSRRADLRVLGVVLETNIKWWPPSRASLTTSKKGTCDLCAYVVLHVRNPAAFLPWWLPKMHSDPVNMWLVAGATGTVTSKGQRCFVMSSPTNSWTSNTTCNPCDLARSTCQLMRVTQPLSRASILDEAIYLVPHLALSPHYSHHPICFLGNIPSSLS